VEAFEKVVDEADFNRVDFKGVIIFSEDQEYLSRSLKTRDNVDVFIRPVSMKQILQSLASETDEAVVYEPASEES
jgi:hypothetical protein